MKKKLLLCLVFSIMCLTLLSTQVYAVDDYFEMPVGEVETMLVKTAKTGMEMVIDDEGSGVIWSGSSETGFKIKAEPGSGFVQVLFIPEVGNTILDTSNGLWFHYKFKITNPNEKSMFSIKMFIDNGTDVKPEINFAGVIQNPKTEKGIHEWSEMNPANGTYEGKINLMDYLGKEYTVEGKTLQAYELPDGELDISGFHFALETADNAEIEVSYLIFDDENASNTLNKSAATQTPTQEPTASPTEKPAENTPTVTPTNNPTQTKAPSSTSTTTGETDENGGMPVGVIIAIVVVALAAVAGAVFFIIKKKKK